MPQDENQQGARGFAAMDEEEQREIARRGGKAAHEKGTAHQFKSGREAQDAGRAGGLARQKNRDNEGAAAEGGEEAGAGEENA